MQPPLGAPIFYRLRRASQPPQRGMQRVGESHIRGQRQSQLKTGAPSTYCRTTRPATPPPPSAPSSPQATALHRPRPAWSPRPMAPSSPQATALHRSKGATESAQGRRASARPPWVTCHHRRAANPAPRHTPRPPAASSTTSATRLPRSNHSTDQHTAELRRPQRKPPDSDLCGLLHSAVSIHSPRHRSFIAHRFPCHPTMFPL
jgi:hypothetical protein